MTHIETARVNETLGLQIGVIQDAARKLQGDDLEQLETDLVELENSIRGLRGILEGLPHHHR
jgi:sRNA-binding protein